MSLRKASTVSVIRFLRAIGPLPRRQRIPRQQQPDAIRREYLKALLPFVNIAKRSFAKVRPDIMRLLVEERRYLGKTDADSRAISWAMLRRAADQAAKIWRPRDLAKVAAQFGKRTSNFNREQLDSQVRAATSVSLAVIEKPIVEKLDRFAAENVKLITGVHERYFERLQGDIKEAFASGMHPSTLAERFSERDEMADKDTMRIARDQIGKLNAEFNEARQKAIGVNRYTWRTANDNRTRDEHQELEGQVFSYDDPPLAGTDGEPANPGESIQCRCYAEPFLEEILSDLDA